MALPGIGMRMQTVIDMYCRNRCVQSVSQLDQGMEKRSGISATAEPDNISAGFGVGLKYLE